MSVVVNEFCLEIFLSFAVAQPCAVLQLDLILLVCSFKIYGLVLSITL